MYTPRSLLGFRPAPPSPETAPADRAALAHESALRAQLGDALTTMHAQHAERVEAAADAYKREIGTPEFVVEMIDIPVPEDLKHPFHP